MLNYVSEETGSAEEVGAGAKELGLKGPLLSPFLSPTYP